MKNSVCHYSFHRTWKKKHWTCEDLASAAKEIGFDAIDFHVGYLGQIDEAAGQIKKALAKTGLELSGLSLSNVFNLDDPQERRKQIQTVIDWMRVAVEVQSPVSRIFGGYIEDRTDNEALANAFSMIIDALGEVTEEAEKLGVILALENHGGLPCSGQEQVEMIETINSENLRARI